MKMLRRLCPSPAMVVACFALLVVLGGTGYAAVQALPRNSVTTVQVKDHSLLARDFKAGQLHRRDRQDRQDRQDRRGRPDRRAQVRAGRSSVPTAASPRSRAGSRSGRIRSRGTTS